MKQACGAAYRWLTANGPTIDQQADEEVLAVAKVVSLAASIAGGWIEVGPVDGFQRTWFEALRASDREGLLGTLYVTHLEERAAFLYRHRSASDVDELLNDSEIAAIGKTASPESLATLLSLRADARRILGNLGGALDDVSRALKVADADSKNQIRLIAQAIEIDLGRLDRARVLLQNIARDAAGAPTNSPLDLNRKIATIRWYSAHGNHLEAATEARRAIGALEPAPNKTIAQRSSLTSLRVSGALAEAMCASEEAAIAAALNKLSKLASDRTVDATSRVAIRLERAELLTRRRGEADSVDALAEVELALSDIDEQLSSSVLLRARSLAQLHSIARRLDDSARRLEIGQGLEASFDQLVRAWEAIELQEGGVGFLEFAARREVLSEVIESRLPMGIEEAFAAVLRVDACGTLSRQLGRLSGSPPPRLAVADVQRMSAQQGVRIIYLIPAASHTHRFTVQDGSIEHHRLDGAQSLGKDIATVRRYVRERPEDSAVAPAEEFELAARTLFDQIFGERDRLPDSGCWIVNIDDLGPAPLVARSEHADSPVGLQVPITVIPSLNTAFRLGRLRSKADAARPRLSIYSLSGPREGRDDIGLTDSEVIGFRSGPFSTNWVGHDAATIEGFKSTLTSGADMFVAWTHGRLDYSSLRPARLILSDGSADRVQHVDSRFIEDTLSKHPVTSAPRVAFIASCKVGQGQKRAGDGAVSHIGGAFLGQGVPVVVVATEDLDRDATLDLMKSFATSFLGDGNTAAKAMLDARRAVASQDGFEHPHFWALPELVGWSPIKAHRE